MSGHKAPDENPQLPDSTWECRDVNLKILAGSLIGTAILTVGSYLWMAMILDSRNKLEAERGKADSPLVSVAVANNLKIENQAITPRSTIPAQGPWLQAMPQLDIKFYKEKQAKLLNEYAVVDDTHARIPIERAIQLVAAEMTGQPVPAIDAKPAEGNHGNHGKAHDHAPTTEKPAEAAH
jgi:hypothetical protein